MADKYKMLVYPVPVKGAYVLGIHSTITVDGRVKIGPTVFPAFAKENYDGLENVTLKSLLELGSAYTLMAMSKKERGMIWQFMRYELKKSLFIDELVKDCNEIQSMDKKDFSNFYKAGIRPQLFDTT